MSNENYEQNLPTELIEQKLNIFCGMWRAYKALPARNLISIILDEERSKGDERIFATIHLVQKMDSIELAETTYAELVNLELDEVYDERIFQDDERRLRELEGNQETMLDAIKRIITFIENTQHVSPENNVNEINEIKHHFSSVAENWDMLFDILISKMKVENFCLF